MVATPSSPGWDVAFRYDAGLYTLYMGAWNRAVKIHPWGGPYSQYSAGSVWHMMGPHSVVAPSTLFCLMTVGSPPGATEGGSWNGLLEWD